MPASPGLAAACIGLISFEGILCKLFPPIQPSPGTEDRRLSKQIPTANLPYRGIKNGSARLKVPSIVPSDTLVK
ncbi:hypothetical protein F5B21DRAFT_486791 [Xylaria acuta]|nr:hypothetical protein F5B21DRAFT_486791 [Xylaria acuta]